MTKTQQRLDEITTRIGATYRVGDSEAQKELLAWPRIREDLEWLVKKMGEGMRTKGRQIPLLATSRPKGD